MKLKTFICSLVACFLALSSLLMVIPVGAAAEDAYSTEQIATDSLPAEYCMRDEYIVYAQNQDKHGYCWNFASTMAASTTIMKATGECYDFSEMWTGIALANYHSSFKKMGQGGSFSYQYDAIKKAGLMLESDMPYSESYTASMENATDYYNFYEGYSNENLAKCLVSDSESSYSKSEVEEIKKHIYNHGSIYLTFMFRTGFVESDGAYYLEPNQKNTNSNHAVSVIGWDDNFEREFYLDGSSTPTVFKGAWIILNSYTEKSGNDGISFVFYNDSNIGSVQGYRYEPDTSRSLYFYDKIESGYSYPTSLKGKYYGDHTAEAALTKQKNIFYNDVNLEYSYTASNATYVDKVDIYLDEKNVTDDFTVRIDNASKRFYISKSNADYGQYKMLVTYSNGEQSDTYLNNFFVTHGLVGEEIEVDYENTDFAFNPGRDLEYYSFSSSQKDYIIYTNKLSGKIIFLPTEQSVYSEKNMSIPDIFYEIVNGQGTITTYRIKAKSGYELDYNFIFEYSSDTSLQPVKVYYNLGGGENHPDNYSVELASSATDLVLYEPTRSGYTFAGWYLDFGNGSRKITEKNDLYYVSWDDIHHLGDNPAFNALGYYNEYYNNSNTLFVYARWEEVDYYNIDIEIIGNGTSQITEKISIGEDDSVKYLFKPGSGCCLSGLKINGVNVSSGELVEIAKNGLDIKNIDSDISITAIFSEGVYLHLNFGENVKNAYVIGTLDGKTEKFYDGDVIPNKYFNTFNNKNDNNDVPDIDDRFNPNIYNKFDPDINDDFNVNLDGLFVPDINDEIFTDYDDIFIPDIDDDWVWNDGVISADFIDADGSSTRGITLIPAFSKEFTLVVEMKEEAGCVYLLDDSYSLSDDGTYSKKIILSGKEYFNQVDIGNVTKKIKIEYSVNSHVLDHYLSTDPASEGGIKNSMLVDEGDSVYLFVMIPDDTAMYYYSLPSGFESIGDGWYRLAMQASAKDADMGELNVQQELQVYSVTWKNWDGSIIYSEMYQYGEIPVFYDKNSDFAEHPVRPSDHVYDYIFSGWDDDVESVTCDSTYIATYEAQLVQYTITVDPTENGVIMPEGTNNITYLDRHTYIFTPAEGYKISDVLLNGESLGAITSYTFSETCSDSTLCVVFEKIKYSVNIICGDNGVTDITGVQLIEHGSNVVINVTPNELFDIDFVKLNGESIDASGAVTIENVTEDMSVEIAFKQVKFNITTSCSDGGTISPSVIISAGEGEKILFTPQAGYRVSDVLIDGVSIGEAKDYTFTNVSSDHTVHVEYERSIGVIIVISAVALVVAAAVIVIPVVLKARKSKLFAQQESSTDQEKDEDDSNNVEEK